MIAEIKHVLVAMLFALAALLSACEDTNIDLAAQAGLEAYKAATLDQEDVMRLASQASAQADREHKLAPPDSHYARRLARLTANRESARGYRFDHRVYLSDKVNAFAMADGTIRIYSGLMELMDDDELLFVIGHEQGHVVLEHLEEKLRLAYAGSALRKAVGSQQNEAGTIARSALGALAEQLVNAQFSQKEEREADDYGLRFLLDNDRPPRAAVSALRKLEMLGGGHTFLSSHPAPDDRASRLVENGLTPQTDEAEKPSLLARIIAWLLSLWPFGDSSTAGA
jgi:putative metalloprotease